MTPSPRPVEDYYKVLECGCPCGVHHEVPLEEYVAALIGQTDTSLAFCRHHVVQREPDRVLILLCRAIRRMVSRKSVRVRRCRACANERISIDPRHESWSEINLPLVEWSLGQCVGLISGKPRRRPPDGNGDDSLKGNAVVEWWGYPIVVLAILLGGSIIGLTVILLMFRWPAERAARHERKRRSVG